MVKPTSQSIADQLREAYSSSESSGEGDFQSLIKTGNSPKQTPVKESKPEPVVEQPKPVEQPQVVQQPEPVVVKPEPTPVQVQQPTPEPVVAQPQPTPVQPEPAPVQAQPEPARVDTFAQNFSQQKSYLDTREISQIIRILDMYRGYDVKIQDTVNQFIQVPKEADISIVINGIINVTDEERFGLKDLVSLKESERTARAFSLVALPDNRLNKVRDLVVLFNQAFKPSEIGNDRVRYCQEIEMGIESLPIQALNFLKPISQLLSIEKG